MFGAYKNFVRSNKIAAVTQRLLIEAALICNLTPESIKEGLEAITGQQVVAWLKMNIGTTL